MIINDGRPCQPWGDDPPPAPVGATRSQLRRVRNAWQAWAPARPLYDRQGEIVRATIHLADRSWVGVGTGATEEVAVWKALQDCIHRWVEDTAVHLPDTRPAARPRPAQPTSASPTVS